MKIRTAAFIAPLCFASSLLAVTSFKDNNALLSDYATEPELQEDVAQNDPANVNNSSSDILLVETKEDRLKLKTQQRQIEKERQSKLTKDLNNEAWLALQKQLQQNGEPAKLMDNVVVDVQKASKISLDDNTDNIELASLSATQTVNKQRVLNLEPPIPPGTLGGGNGNGGPGAAQISASAN